MADCKDCDGKCCKYITIQIDEPKADIDYEELKWFLCHENIMVYVDHDDDWCVEVKTPCKFQDKETNLCTRYENRPKVCQEHELHECEGNNDYDDYDQQKFETPEDVDAYRNSKKAQEIQGKETKD